jgi:hypothetical protein
MKKLGTYKEGRFNVTYDSDGTIWSVMPNPFQTEEQRKRWEELPDGYKFPEPDYTGVVRDTKLVIMDFGTTPPTILDIKDYVEDRSGT